MDMEHNIYLMAVFQECNVHTWRGSAVFYYDIISIQLNAEMWVLASTVIFELVLAQGISSTNTCWSVNVYSIVTGLYIHITLYFKM
jgi:hypothetical protein